MPWPVIDRPPKIILVEPESGLTEMLVEALVRRFDAQVTCLASAEACLDVEMLDPHDLIITEMDLDGTSGLQLASDLTALGRRSVILLAGELDCDDAIEALRVGVCDLFRKPFPVAELMDCAARLIRGQHLETKRADKYHRMRSLVRRIISERRDLKRRTELICRDLVGAHRKLVNRVLSFEEMRWKQSG